MMSALHRCRRKHGEIEKKRRRSLDRFEFFTGGSHMNYVSGNTVNGVEQQNYLQLRVDNFCTTIFDAADEWDVTVTDDPVIQAEKAKLLVIHQPGTTIGGIRWG